MLPLIVESSWLPKQGRSKTSISVPSRRIEIKDPTFQLTGQKMTTPRTAMEEEQTDSISVVLSSNSSFYLPLVVSGMQVKAVISRESRSNMDTRSSVEVQPMPCQHFSRVKVI